nr:MULTISPECIES: hypothetical protein [unclassified Streptomyces]
MSRVTTVSWAATTRWAGTVRRPSASAGFSSAIRSSASAVAVVRSKILDVLPLWRIALRNRPVAAGAASSAPIEKAPADWPARVTLPGSPPNAAMLSPTQRRAAVWSWRPRFVDPSQV